MKSDFWVKIFLVGIWLLVTAITVTAWCVVVDLIGLATIQKAILLLLLGVGEILISALVWVGLG